ncbi:hypothetical protein [Streptomyces sp. NPDC006999]|uniref:hypothetical protein n=1 Tax=Streptomyces sp. NPDC006999 TaxID=3156909 RepID=UPI0033C28EB6
MRVHYLDVRTRLRTSEAAAVWTTAMSREGSGFGHLSFRRWDTAALLGDRLSPHMWGTGPRPQFLESCWVRLRFPPITLITVTLAHFPRDDRQVGTAMRLRMVPDLRIRPAATWHKVADSLVKHLQEQDPDAQVQRSTAWERSSVI